MRAAILAFVMLPSSVHAGCVSQSIDRDTVLTTCSDGSSYTANTFGDTTITTGTDAHGNARSGVTTRDSKGNAVSSGDLYSDN